MEAVALQHSSAISLGALARIPIGEGRTFVVGSERIAVFRTRRGPIFATQAACPHRGGPLSDGTVGGKVLICPLHAFKFDLATGLPLGNDCAALKTYPVEVSATGEILVQVGAR